MTLEGSRVNPGSPLITIEFAVVSQSADDEDVHAAFNEVIIK